MDPAFLISVTPWQASGAASGSGAADPFAAAAARAPVAAALRHWPSVAARVRGHASQGLGVVLVDSVPPGAMLALLAALCRGDDWAIGIHLDAPLDPRMAALRIATAAKRSPWGVAVRVERGQVAFRTGAYARTASLDATLAMHVTLLRQRSMACWQALDAVAEHGTATAAAAALGCSQQAISAHLRRSNHRATARTALIVELLLGVPSATAVAAAA